MMTPGLSSGVWMSVKQRYLQPGRGLESMCVEAFFSCAVGGSTYMLQMHG